MQTTVLDTTMLDLSSHQGADACTQHHASTTILYVHEATSPLMNERRAVSKALFSVQEMQNKMLIVCYNEPQRQTRQLHCERCSKAPVMP